MGAAAPPGFEAVARVEELPEGTLLGVETPGGARICLVHHAGRITALADRCSHRDFPLSAGSVEPDGTVLCAWHGAQFDCRTGAVCHGPAKQPVPTYEVRVVEGEIWVRTG